MLKAKFARKRASARTTSPLQDSETVTVFVGVESREFILNKRLLSTVSEYFADRLDASGVNFVQRNAQLNALWLEDFDPEMFELFAYWLGEQAHHEAFCSVSFRPFLDEAEAQDCCKELHWDLINLHLFAARIELDSLQDAAMDAIQDLYLRCDWDVTPRLVTHIYTECEPTYSYRLRKWAVAMAAWSMGDAVSTATTATLHELFAACPVFRDDYIAHLAKSSRSRIRLQFKNPQLRLPTNSLRNDERQFGYRQCSFHTHRSSVGQGRCPHDGAALPVLALSKPLPQEPLSDEDSDLELLTTSPGGATAGGLYALHANMPLMPLSPVGHSAIINMYLDIR